MVIKTVKGCYRFLKNVKDAYQNAQFEECYIEECFDSYPYIVGDISDEKLRIKGFNEDVSSPSYYKLIPDYILESCAYQTPYFILKRITEEEYETCKDEKMDSIVTQHEEKSFILVKKPFDKESLSLKYSKKNDPNIKIDSEKMNEVTCYPLPDDLKDEVIKSRLQETSQKKFSRQKNSRDKTQNQVPNNKNNTNKNNSNQKNGKNFKANDSGEVKIFSHINSKK